MFSRIQSFFFQIFLWGWFSFLQLWKLRATWLQMVWAFLCETFLQRCTRGGHAGKLSLHNLIWQIWYMPKTWHFTIQTFYGAALCFKHNTAFKEHAIIQPPPQVPRVLLKIYGGRNKAAPHHGIKSSAHPLIPSSSLLCSPGWQG